MDSRLYFKGSDGRFRRVVEFEAQSDNEAIGVAEDYMTRGDPMELWQLARKVCEFPELSSQGRGTGGP